MSLSQNYSISKHLNNNPKKAQQQMIQKILAINLSKDKVMLNGVPTPAVIIFRCLLQWGSFMKDSTKLFSLITTTISTKLKGDQDNDGVVVYWLSVCNVLYHLSTLISTSIIEDTHLFSQKEFTKQEENSMLQKFIQDLSKLIGLGLLYLTNKAMSIVSPLVHLNILAHNTSDFSEQVEDFTQFQNIIFPIVQTISEYQAVFSEFGISPALSQRFF